MDPAVHEIRLKKAQDIAFRIADEMVKGQITTSAKTAMKHLEVMLYQHIEVIEAAGYVLITKEEYETLNK